MYFYAPPFSIVKKENNNFILNDTLGGKYEFDKRLLVDTLSVIGEEERDLDNELKSKGEELVESEFLKKTKYRRNNYFDYRKVRNRIMEDGGNFNDLMNIGSVTFALIKQCPYNCSECYAKERIRKEDSGDFKEKDLYRTIEQISKLGANDISISGGEPTTSRKTLEKTLKIAEIAGSFNIPARLITTGYNLKKYSKELFSSPISHYQISLDGKKEYNDNYKKFKGATERSIEAIKTCKENEKDYSINTVITKDNLDDLDEFVDFLEKIGADNLRVAKVISDNTNISLDPKESKKLKDKIEELKNRSSLNINGTYDNQYIQRKNVDCVAGKLYAHIDCYGELFPCAFMQDISLGNIYEKEFMELWNLNNFQLKQFEEGITPNISCIKCNERYHCFGNCRKECEIKNEQCKE